MTFKNFEALAIADEIDAYLARLRSGDDNIDRTNPRLVLRLARNLRKLNNELKEYRQKRQDLTRSAFKTDGDGNFVDADGKAIKPGGNPVFDTEKLEEANAALREIADEELDVEIHMIPIDWLPAGDVDFTMRCMDIIDGDD